MDSARSTGSFGLGKRSIRLKYLLMETALRYQLSSDSAASTLVRSVSASIREAMVLSHSSALKTQHCSHSSVPQKKRKKSDGVFAESEGCRQGRDPGASHTGTPGSLPTVSNTVNFSPARVSGAVGLIREGEPCGVAALSF